MKHDASAVFVRPVPALGQKKAAMSRMSLAQIKQKETNTLEQHSNPDISPGLYEPANTRIAFPLSYERAHYIGLSPFALLPNILRKYFVLRKYIYDNTRSYRVGEQSWVKLGEVSGQRPVMMDNRRLLAAHPSRN